MLIRSPSFTLTLHDFGKKKKKDWISRKGTLNDFKKLEFDECEYDWQLNGLCFSVDSEHCKAA